MLDSSCHWFHIWIIGSMFVIGSSYALKCWHCIADNCEIDPEDNNKAEQRACKKGQHCQKVYFEMHSTYDNKMFHSTVRGCAWNCVQQNDFANCSRDLYSSRGCIEKLCCDDNDLCNKSNAKHVVKFPGILGSIIGLTTILHDKVINRTKSKILILIMCIFLSLHDIYLTQLTISFTIVNFLTR